MTVEKDKVVFLHTPKTGGAAMQQYFYRQFREIRRNYFLAFSGYDDSRFIRDELSTQSERGNHCTIEEIFANPELCEEFRSSPHFQQAKVLFGHTTTAFGTLYPEYRFRYLMVLREPIERTISNIVQLSWVDGDLLRFGGYGKRVERFSDEYWDFIYDVLARDYPVKGLLRHENLFLRNCMTRMLQGSRYLDEHEVPNLKLALANALRCELAFFDDFNNGIQRCFIALGIPVEMSLNRLAAKGEPDASREKAVHGRFYNGPQSVLDWVAAHTATDVRLYELLKSRGDAK